MIREFILNLTLSISPSHKALSLWTNLDKKWSVSGITCNLIQCHEYNVNIIKKIQPSYMRYVV